MSDLKTYTTEAIVQGHTPHIGPMKQWVSLDGCNAKMRELTDGLHKIIAQQPCCEGGGCCAVTRLIYSWEQTPKTWLI